MTRVPAAPPAAQMDIARPRTTTADPSRTAYADPSQLLTPNIPIPKVCTPNQATRYSQVLAAICAAEVARLRLSPDLRRRQALARSRRSAQRLDCAKAEESEIGSWRLT